ncbi:hypothetical protein BGX28_001818, partial [Mortierella sp. GBA30]
IQHPLPKEPETIYDRLNRMEAEEEAVNSTIRNSTEVDDDPIADAKEAPSPDNGSDSDVDPAEQRKDGRRKSTTLNFEALLEQLVFLQELADYFKELDGAEGISKAPRTRAQQREDEVSHEQLHSRHAVLSENSKSQYSSALRVYE